MYNFIRLNFQIVDVPNDDTICARPGDIIGIQYANTNTPGVVPYEQSGRTNTAGVDHNKLSRLFNQEVGDSSLPVGKEKTASVHAVKRLPALKPTISIGMYQHKRDCPDSKVHGANMTQVGPMLAPWTLLSGWYICGLGSLVGNLTKLALRYDFILNSLLADKDFNMASDCLTSQTLANQTPC